MISDGALKTQTTSGLLYVHRVRVYRDTAYDDIVEFTLEGSLHLQRGRF